MEAKKAKKNKVRGIKNAFIVIIICFIVALVVFTQVLGAPENFEGGDPTGGHPLNLLGTIYKGGFIVPILQTLLLTVIVLSVERHRRCSGSLRQTTWNRCKCCFFGFD